MIRIQPSTFINMTYKMFVFSSAVDADMLKKAELSYIKGRLKNLSSNLNQEEFFITNRNADDIEDTERDWVEKLAGCTLGPDKCLTRDSTFMERFIGDKRN